MLHESQPIRSLWFTALPGLFAVCRVGSDFKLPDSHQDFLSFTRTQNEFSLVCPQGQAPAGKVERGWVCFQLEGPFPFTMTGVLASFLQPLAEASVPVFAVSTYDTDYVLIKRELRDKALSALIAAGHELLA